MMDSMQAGKTVLDAEFVHDMAMREAVYGFLSAVYLTEVTREFIEGLKEGPIELEGDLAAFAASLDGADLEEVRRDLASEYARVFLGMSPSPVAPYESVYRSELHILMQEPRDEVLAAYRAGGLTVAKELRLPEDHVAFEFAYLAHLCGKAARAAETGDASEALRCARLQAAFLNDHVLAWLPELCTDVEKRAKTLFYRGVVQLTREFLESEREYAREFAA